MEIHLRNVHGDLSGEMLQGCDFDKQAASQPKTVHQPTTRKAAIRRGAEKTAPKVHTPPDEPLATVCFCPGCGFPLEMMQRALAVVLKINQKHSA
jgi:hypothetical protein